MLRPHGYSRLEGGPEGLVEEDTVRCVHCQKIGFVQRAGKVLWPQIHPLPQDQYTCRQCYSPICPSCANSPCRHFEKWLEAMESKSGLVRSRLDQLAELAHRAAKALGL